MRTSGHGERVPAQDVIDDLPAREDSDRACRISSPLSAGADWAPGRSRLCPRHAFSSPPALPRSTRTGLVLPAPWLGRHGRTLAASVSKSCRPRPLSRRPGARGNDALHHRRPTPLAWSAGFFCHVDVINVDEIAFLGQRRKSEGRHEAGRRSPSKAATRRPPGRPARVPK